MCAARGCGGSRIKGGLYLVTNLVKNGTPLYKFIIDPPIPVPGQMDIPFRGVAIRERPDGSGIFDVYDHVGSEHYPNVLDFIAEVAKLGLSRHVSKLVDFEKITPESRIILAHERAVLTNHNELYERLHREFAEYPDHPHGLSCRCITHQEAHDAMIQGPIGTNSVCCAGVWNQLITGGEDSFDPTLRPRTVKRTVGDTTYSGFKAPEKFNPDYQRGFFMALPLSGIELVKGGKNDADSLDRASQSGIDVTEVNE